MGTKSKFPVTFEDWMDDNYPKGPMLRWPSLPRLDIEMFMMEAYEAGWNSCRDKWGGMDYHDTLRDEDE